MGWETEIIFITKIYQYNFDHLKPHFYIYSKKGFTGVYIVFLISAQKHRLFVLVRTASIVLSRGKKNISFISEKFQLLVVKFQYI